MAESTKFGPGSALCAQCEAMLADAGDGTLPPAEQALFDAHIARCGACAQRLAEARRGAAWLGMLRDSRPEPPAGLAERIVEHILAQTEGRSAAAQSAAQFVVQSVARPSAPQGAPALAGAVRPIPQPALAAAVFARPRVPLGGRIARALRANSLAQVLFEPRLAMTAAMAFFSIALTLDLFGVHLNDLHLSDLKPSSLQRSFYQADARVVQYYEGLRVVYELESRVHDLQDFQDLSAQPGTQPASTGQPDKQPSEEQNRNQQRQPERLRPGNSSPRPGNSSSRGEAPVRRGLYPGLHLAAAAQPAALPAAGGRARA